jgi:hypothetical protein
MSTWRITTKSIDRSSTVRGEAGSVGAMAIRSLKGPVKPVKIFKGEEKRIIDLFGKPSVTYPDVWEAIEYNKQDDMWISAPYDTSARLGGVLVTDTGSVALSTGVTPSALSSYSFNSADEYFVLTSRSPYADDLGVIITYSSTTTFFTIVLYRTSDGGTTWETIDTYIVSTTVNQKDGFGKNIYIEDIFDEDHDYLLAKVNSSGDISNGFVDDTSRVSFASGTRGSTITITELTAGWAYFQEINNYPADIFMDPTTNSGIPAIFNTLRTTYQKYSYYIMPLPASETPSTSITTKSGYSINNSGLAFYWNRGKVRDTYNNSSFWTSLIGRVGKKLAQMEDLYNGGAPYWEDENNHGGQLGSGILELEYDPTESQLESLDVAGINPIIFDPIRGVMIVSQKTGQTATTLSDTTYIAHTRLFDYIKTNIITNVLNYQVGKLNDELHRRMAVSKGTTLLDPILADNLLAEYEIQCDLNNNTTTTMADRKFIYTVGVKVTPYSETITFEFVNVGQTVTLSEVIG